MEFDKKSIYKLTEISEWAEKDHVSLPNVQRGFVWKASQIENLWDSLLRGYPVGSFVLSPKKNSENKFELLDGQQRVTAICLGFQNKTFKEDTQNRYKLFIDLEFPNSEDSREYIFRVITKSHPWGYSRNDNSKTLTAEDKRNAIELYNKENWLEEDIDNFFPYEASLSVPFNYFIESALINDSETELLKKIENNWFDKSENSLWTFLKNKWLQKIQQIISSGNLGKSNFKQSLEICDEGKIEQRIKDIYSDVKKMLSTQQVPALYLDFELLKDRQRNLDAGSESLNNKKNDDQENDKDSDAIENLFIRLNSGGTILSGEDLNYSILKSNLKNETLIIKIESACKDYMQPSRFITLAYKLYQKEKNKNEALLMRVKPKQFQKTIYQSNGGESFELFVSNLLNEKVYNGNKMTLLEYAIYLLEYNKLKHPNGLPHLIVCKVAQAAPEIMFMLFYRLKYNKDEFEYGSEEHCRALGLFTILMWLGKGEKQRDHAKVLTNIWPAVETLPTDKFWTASTVQRALLNKTMSPLPSFKKTKEGKLLVRLTQAPKSNTPIWDKLYRNSNYYEFASSVFYERDLIVYAQRKFLSDIFKNQEYHQEDTNMPFDWDHISPAKFIYSKKGIPRIIKESYNTIGNLRAWPYALNRTDQAVTPNIKFNPIHKLHYSDYEYFKIINSWQSFIDKNKGIINELKDLKAKLLDWSYCTDKKWVELDSEDMKRDWQPTYNLIMARNFAIIRNWYDSLRIEDLLFHKIATPSIVLNKSKWKLLNKKNAYKELKEALIDDDFQVWIYKSSLNSINKVFYYFFQFSKSQDDILAEDNFVFGLYSCKQDEFIKSIKITEKLKNVYSTNSENYIHGNFTLISHEKESYLKLIDEIDLWLKEFPVTKGLKAEIVSSFFGTINTKFRK